MLALLALTSTALAGSPPVHLGASASLGPALRVQDGVAEVRPSVDLLDVEAHIGRVQLVPRLGRFLVGRLAMGITDVELSTFLRVRRGDAGWIPLVGVGPRLVVGAGRTSLGGRALLRLGRHTGGEHGRHWVFAEAYAGVDGGPEHVVFDAGLRVGGALTWRLSR